MNRRKFLLSVPALVATPVFAKIETSTPILTTANPFVGITALQCNTTGHFNTGMGREAMRIDSNGNVGIGIGVSTRK
jgi:hypothetical protein